MKRSRLRENIIALTSLQALNYIAPLITVPYLMRVLGPERFGLLAFAQAVIIYFDLITSYGFNLGTTRTVAGCRENLSALSETFWSTLYAQIALMLASAGVLAVLVYALPQLRAVPLLYAAAGLTVVGTALFPVWFFQGLEEMWPVTFAQAGARTLSVPALLLLVRHSEDYVRAAAIQGAVPVVAAAFAAPLVWKRLRTRPPRPRIAAIAGSLRANWHLFLAQTGMALSMSSTTVVLGFVSNATAVGYYSAADKVIRAVCALLGPVARALYPHLTTLRTHSAALTFRVMKTSFAWIVALAAAVSAATFLLAAPVAPLIWGPGFAASVVVLRWLSPFPLVFALVNILGTQVLLVFEKDAVVSRIVLAGAGANVLLAAALSWRFAAVGAAAATVGSGCLIVLFLAWNVRSIYAARRPSIAEVYAS